MRPDQTMIVGDILDVNQTWNAIKGQDIIYHFAGLADLDHAADKAMETVNQNIVGTIHLLDDAVEFKVGRFVFVADLAGRGRRRGGFRLELGGDHKLLDVALRDQHSIARRGHRRPAPDEILLLRWDAA